MTILPSAVTYTTEVLAPAVPVTASAAVQHDLLLCLLCHLIQGSTKPFALLVSDILEYLSAKLPGFVALLGSSTNSSTASVSGLSTTSSEALGELIKSLAGRTAHGYRQKSSLSYSNTYAYALWRWEVNSNKQHVLQYYHVLDFLRSGVSPVLVVPVPAAPAPAVAAVDAAQGESQLEAGDMQDIPATQSPSSASALPAAVLPATSTYTVSFTDHPSLQSMRSLLSTYKDLRCLRRAYGAVVRHVYHSVDLLMVSASEEKLASVDEKMHKAIQEVEKLIEKRTADERKRLAKGELDATKRGASLRLQMEKDAKAAEAKAKEQAKLAKQQHIFKSFLVKADVESVPQAQPQAMVVDMIQEDDRLDAFLASITGSVAFKPIAPQEKRAIAAMQRKTRYVRPRTVTLPVAVVAAASTSTAASSSSAPVGNLVEDKVMEIVLQVFPNRLITIGFHDSHRPAYVGTHRKRDALTSMQLRRLWRAPECRSNALVNYDEDSEDEYEEQEEEEGESVDEHEEAVEVDEDLEYDEVFVRDEDEADFKINHKEEKLGPYFIRNFTQLVTGGLYYDPEHAQGYMRQGAELMRCTMLEDAEINKLASYSAVIYA